VQPQYFFENRDLKLGGSFRGFFLFLDFDGTLVPIQDNPTQCFLSPKTKSQLETISLSEKASIAVLSGRSLKDIKKRVQIQGIYYGGSHGLEISGPNLNYLHPDALCGKRVIDRIFRKIEKRICGIRGAFIEKKNFGFSLHYRSAEKEGKALIKEIFREVIANDLDPQAFFVLRGKKVLELVPRIKWNKGRAALFLLQSQKKDCLPIYVGDDVTDEAAFNALRAHGVTIRIGRSKKTQAEYYLKGQWEILRFLEYIHNFMR
jgi:trehalose-phosphatase